LRLAMVVTNLAGVHRFCRAIVALIVGKTKWRAPPGTPSISHPAIAVALAI
jgi:hypothetical protein